MSLIEKICDELDLVNLAGCAPADVEALEAGLNLIVSLVKRFSAGEYISPREASEVFHLMNLLRAAVNDSRRKKMFEEQLEAVAALDELEAAAEAERAEVELILAEVGHAGRDALWAFNDEYRLVTRTNRSSNPKVKI